ncbi:LD-carboxypeptidase [Chromobacterium sp. ATCC 53434]|uniref:LD-carboxypeptidase n=1 Tax=Chromobacterium sp. (strain ATCC 53434 / SC 14030) TaxID=2059672 RepID=UPI000C786BA1|nr:LD-carboxypeptidase [Chromobacterium sp. ATCC 53434]AUH51005.1 LD-carboxypeptidase [Chromobacterium sp. ATCC 53434]
MIPDIDPTRRQLLQCLAIGAGAAALQGCRTMIDQNVPSTPSAGHRLYLTACSGIVPARQQQLALPRLRQAGFALENTEALARSHQRFAGTDAERLADLNRLLAQPQLPEMVLAARGGYGAMRLLPQLDLARLGARVREARALLVGYSDFSAIQLALLAKSGVGSFAGPMLGDFGSAAPSAYAIDEFFRTVTTPQRSLNVPGPHASARGEGLFWGGNLSVLSSLAGTPYLPDIKGGLLFLEDVGEQPYRVERMLQQLYLAGVLTKQRAIFLGDFSMRKHVDAYDPRYDFDAVVAELRRISGVPVFTGLPFGHIADKTTLPLGFPARFQADESGLALQFLDYPTISPLGLQPQALLETLAV